jgi:hypothetical protein
LNKKLHFLPIAFLFSIFKEKMQNIDKEEEKKVLKNQNEQKLLGSGGIRTHASEETYKRCNVRRKFHVCLLCNNMLILPKSKIVEIIIGWK